MRWLWALMLAGSVSAGAPAQETVVESTPVPDVVAPVKVYDLAPAPVVVNKVEMPRVAEFRSLDRPRQARKNASRKSMLLSRSVRNQMALFTVRNGQAAGIVQPTLFEDTDDSTGLDDLDLHRFFSRPRVVHEEGDAVDDEAGLSDYVKLRLLMARMKAVEAHAMAQAMATADDGVALSDHVRDRLAEARAKALEAHSQKFS